MGQISIVIIAGLIFLISFESGENHVSTNHQQICLVTLIMVDGSDEILTGLKRYQEY
jgi:hypothetical protein